MFYAGCAVMYYVVLPYVINLMLAHYVPPDIEKTLRSSDYLSRVLQLVFAFGFAFEVPVLLTLLVRVRILTTSALRSTPPSTTAGAPTCRSARRHRQGARR